MGPRQDHRGRPRAAAGSRFHCLAQSKSAGALQWITTRNGGVVPEGIATRYPEPTIFNDHLILALTQASKKLIQAVEDDAVQDIAWKKYGFRSETRVVEQVFQGVDVPSTHTIKKT
jgi:hypothetical protein